MRYALIEKFLLYKAYFASQREIKSLLAVHRILLDGSFSVIVKDEFCCRLQVKDIL